MKDRGLPDWANYMAFFFALLGGICVLGLATVTVFLQDLIVARSDAYGLIALLGLGLVPVIGMGLVEFGAQRALAGFRAARLRATTLANAIVGVFIFLVLSVLHPFVGLAVPAAVLLAASGIYLTLKFSDREPAWDFNAFEAIAFLAGRDRKGMKLASAASSSPAMVQTFVQLAIWVAVLAACGLASFLAASAVIAASAVPAVVLCSAWASFAICNHLALRWSDPAITNKVDIQEHALTDVSRAAVAHQGLVVDALTARMPDGRKILSNVGFEVPNGTALCILGDAAGGKSMLAQALVDPFALDQMALQGVVEVDGTSLWQRSTSAQSLPAALIGDASAMLPAPALQNMGCFQGPREQAKARRVLESLVHSTDVVDRILAAENAQDLSRSDQRAVEFARVFYLNPLVMVFDRPEFGANDTVLTALTQKLRQAKRTGRCIVLISEDRRLTDLCDNLLVLQDGRRIDYGPANEVQARRSSGWHRFTCPAELESEDILESWLRSLFRRKGDEENRRRLCNIGAELLAVSCQGLGDKSQDINFDFKHFVGHCVLRLTDRGGLFSSGQIQLAGQESATQAPAPRSALGRLLEGVLDFEQTLSDGTRVIALKIQSDDPRLVQKTDTPAKVKG